MQFVGICCSFLTTIYAVKTFKQIFLKTSEVISTKECNEETLLTLIYCPWVFHFQLSSNQGIALDERVIFVLFFFSSQKHTLWYSLEVPLTSNEYHNRCFCGEIRDIITFWLKKVPYLELCKLPELTKIQCGIIPSEKIPMLHKAPDKRRYMYPHNIFSYFSTITCCGYSLEAPWRGTFIFTHIF